MHTGGRNIIHDSASSSPQACASYRSIGISPLGNYSFDFSTDKHKLQKVELVSNIWNVIVSGTGGAPDSAGVTSHRRSSTQSDTSALVSSLTRDLSQSPSQATASTRDPSPSPSASSSLHSPPDSTPNTPNKQQVIKKALRLQVT